MLTRTAAAPGASKSVSAAATVDAADQQALVARVRQCGPVLIADDIDTVGWDVTARNADADLSAALARAGRAREQAALDCRCRRYGAGGRLDGTAFAVPDRLPVHR